ncbi:MAG TPA: hypothetical protein VMA13_06245 [Candidatus Saccharimonadales bacterium]|nr:hypothetical protein [Candidatus Saccharimonadales bacterium]
MKIIANKSIQQYIAALLIVIGACSAHAQVQTNAPPPKPKIKWASSAAAGLTLTSGNSKTTLATVTAATDGKWDQSELSIEGDAAYGRSKTSGQTTATTTAELLHGIYPVQLAVYRPLLRIRTGGRTA